MEDKPIPMYGDGSTAGDYTYVSDIVDGTIRILDYVSGNNNIYIIFNLGGSNPISLIFDLNDRRCCRKRAKDSTVTNTTWKCKYHL